jgi:hypothetical protein
MNKPFRASEENMRGIVVGCEYTGVTTLIEGLMDWGHERGINHHLDDHFTIPDRQHLAPEDRETMVNLSPALKERFQRMQLVYHIRLLHRFDHILLGGFHIEEAVYGPLYYYPGGVASEIREYEEEMPKNAILVHLTARPEVIQRRMETDPHEYSLIKKEDIPMLLDRFQEEFDASLIPNKLQIDTSDLAPEALLQTFLNQSAQFTE